MNFKSLLTILGYLSAVGISICLLFFVVTCVWIGHDVKSQCKEAQVSKKGDCVQSLIFVLDDTNMSYRKRNHAIWALGQLGDSRATPVLKKYYTGDIPARESLNKTISQYELKKAIKLTEGGLNISAFLWRTKDLK